MDAFYATVEPLFTADPLLIYDFLYLCPEGDYPKLFHRIPAFLSLALLASYKRLPHYQRDVSVISKINILHLFCF